MTVFNGITSVKRAVMDPGTDHRLQSPRSLSWAAITTPTALTGTTGDHCDIVHGDRSYRFTGSRTETITGDHKHSVGGNQTIMIGGKHKETIVQDCNQSYIGPHLVTNHTVRNETRMASCNTCYGNWWVNDNPDQCETIDGEEYCGQGGRWYYADTYYQFTRILNHELATSKVEAHGVHVEVGAAHAAAKLFHCEFDLTHPSGYLNDDQIFITREQYNAVDLTIYGSEQKVHMFDTSVETVQSVIKSLSIENAAVHSGNELAVHSLPRIGTFIPPPLPV
jgi:hypothetical protein